MESRRVSTSQAPADLARLGRRPRIVGRRPGRAPECRVSTTASEVGAHQEGQKSPAQTFSPRFVAMPEGRGYWFNPASKNTRYSKKRPAANRWPDWRTAFVFS